MKQLEERKNNWYKGRTGLQKLFCFCICIEILVNFILILFDRIKCCIYAYKGTNVGRSKRENENITSVKCGDDRRY